MAEWTWTDKEIDEEYVKACEATRIARETEPHGRAARYDRESGKFIVDLLNGATFIFPPDLVEGLRGAHPDHLAEVEVTPIGDGLHWETLDVDFSVANLLLGIFGSKAWMARIRSEIARRAGSTTSEAKARAARQNGRKGGRPRKTAG